MLRGIIISYFSEIKSTCWMKADDLFEILGPKLRRLGRTEKIKLYHKIISESHPAFRLKKRGKMRSCEELKQKLRKDVRIALSYQNV